MARWASGGIILSSVAIRYQLGLVLHAGSLIVPLRAATPHGNLRIGPERCLFCVHIGGERGGELCLVLEQITVLRRQYWRHGGAGWRMFIERGHGLPFVRSERGDVRQPCNVWMVPGFSDHRSSVGVADEDCRSVLRCKSSLGNCYVVLQRHCRILDNADTVAISPEDLVDTLPARAVHKGTVH